MANKTLLQYPAGSVQYRIEFDYLARQFVFVTLVDSLNPRNNQALTVGNDYRFLNPTTIEVLADQGSYDIVQINRFTSTSRLVDFRNGSVLTASDLTTSELQAIHIAEEGRDQTLDLARQYAEEAKDSVEQAENILNDIVKQAQFGYTVVGSFELGAEVKTKNDAVSLGAGDELGYYIWEGALPKSVPKESTPQTTGGIGKGAWQYVGYNINIIQKELQGNIPNKWTPMPRTNMQRLVARTDNNVWRFATWNLQGWQAAVMVDAKNLAGNNVQYDRQERILNARVDVCGMQECLYSKFHPVSTLAVYPLKNTFFGAADWGGHADLSGFKYGNSFISRGEMTGAMVKVYDDKTGTVDKELRSYVKMYVQRGDVKVAIFNTHMSLEEGRRNNMMAELLKAAKAETVPCIVMGDFNTETMSDYQGFKDAGFTLAHEREINTNAHGATWYIDNIMYRGFARKTFVGSQDAYYNLSDHKMLICELEVK